MNSILYKKNHIIWIDITKFIAIFLVVYAHFIGIFPPNKVITDFIYLFHMPLFFILSGYLYHQTNKEDELKKIFWRLLIPYLIYQFVYLPLQIGSCIINHNQSFILSLWKCIIGILCGDGYTTSFFQNVCFPCWFLISIMQVRFIFMNVKMSVKTLIVISFISFIILKFLMLNKIDLFFCIDNTLMAIPYFCFGYLLKNNFSNILDRIVKLNIFSKVALSVLCIIILITILKINGVIQMNLEIIEPINSKSLILAYLGGITGAILVYIFSNFFQKENIFVKTIAQNTLFIMFFHTIFLFLTKTFNIDSSIINLPFQSLIFIFYSLILFIFMYFIINFIYRYCPLVLGKYNYSKENTNDKNS